MTPFLFEHEAFWYQKACNCNDNYFKKIVKLSRFLRVGTDSIHRGAEKREDVCETVSARITVARAPLLSDGEKKSKESKGHVS